MPFQISLFCPETVDIAKLGFSALHISFSDGRPDVIIESEQSSGDFVDLDDVAVSRRRTAHLAWQPGRCLVMHGTLSSALEADVQVSYSLTELTADHIGEAGIHATDLERGNYL